MHIAGDMVCLGQTLQTSTEKLLCLVGCRLHLSVRACDDLKPTLPGASWTVPGTPVDTCLSSILTAPGTGIGARCSLLSCSLLRLYMPVFRFKQHDKKKSHDVVIVARHATATWHLMGKAEGKPWSLHSARTESWQWHWLGTLGPLCTGQFYQCKANILHRH